MASFMGMIMVVGIVAKNGILLLDAEQRFRQLGFSAEESMIQAGTATAATNRDDSVGNHCGNVAVGAGDRIGIADAAASGDWRDRRIAEFDCAVADPDPAIHFYLGQETNPAAA